LVYALSIGPAYKLHYAGWLPVDIRSLYLPLGWLADRSRPVNRFLGWYIYDVWRCPTVRI
jgi:hypothetical protein